MTKLSNVKRKELFKWFIEGNKEKGIKKAKLNFAHIAIAELLKQGYFSRILTVNFDPLLIHACYMVGMYPFPAIYDLGAMGKVNAELLHDPSIVYLNGQHVGFVQRNTTDQLEAHKETLSQIVRSTGCSKTWVVAGYSGENDPLMDALNELRPYNNWLYWLEYGNQVLHKESHHFLEHDEECKVVYGCDADETFMDIAEHLNCSLDFIENPQKELEGYLKEIDFETVQQGKIYKDKIISMIKLLSSEENQTAIETINKEKLLNERAWNTYNTIFKTDDKNKKIELGTNALFRFEELQSLYNDEIYIVFQCITLLTLYKISSNTEFTSKLKNKLKLIYKQKSYRYFIQARLYVAEKKYDLALNELKQITDPNLIETIKKEPDFNILRSNLEYSKFFKDLE